MALRNEPPYMRIGHCCGPCAVVADQQLYKIPDRFRYRCAPCYRNEYGAAPYTMPNVEHYERDLKRAFSRGRVR